MNDSRSLDRAARPSMNLASWLCRAASARPEHPALRYGERTIAWAELADRAARLAGFLDGRGLRPGERVGVLMWNAPEFLEVMLAGFHGGFPIVPVNARATPHEAEQVLRDAGVSALVYGAEYGEHATTVAASGRTLLLPLEADALAEGTLAGAIAEGRGRREPAALAADHIAWIFYTSGTTGTPKGAMLSHRNLLAMVMAYLADIRSLDAASVVLHAAPLSHGSGLYALPALARGATQVLTTSRSYDPAEVLGLVDAHGATDIAFLSPTMLNRLVTQQLAAPAGLDTLENIVYGGAPMHRPDLLRALDALGPRLTQIYGQAEAPVTISRLGRAEHRAARAGDPDRLLSAGTAYTNVEIAVREADDGVKAHGYGEILVRGDVVMAGYWANPDATAESVRDGWLHTGDVGRIDEDGTVYLLDRSKDVIISGGANIYPREVEEVVLEHADVRQVAVIGAPDPEWGERVVAVVATHDGAPAERVRAEVTALCRERLSGYKIPRDFDFRDELPTSPYGKVLKRELRDSYWQGQRREI